MTSESPRELQERLAAERAGRPFLVLRDDERRQRLVVLDGDELIVGADAGSAVELAWDPTVSGVHARLERAGQRWTVCDDELSTNGTYVNEERVHGRRVLRDGDLVRFGETVVRFHAPVAPARRTVKLSSADLVAVTDAQRRVLVALCRPFKGRPAFARPATNEEIAEELVLSVEAVKTHLRALFEKFGLKDVPQSEKRMRLVEHVLSTGVVRDHEL